jgi:hypothetical protein
MDGSDHIPYGSGGVELDTVVPPSELAGVGWPGRSGALDVKLDGAKWSGGNEHSHLGFDGCGETMACSHDGELLIFKLGDDVGEALVVLRLQLSFLRRWSSSRNLLR